MVCPSVIAIMTTMPPTAAAVAAAAAATISETWYTRFEPQLYLYGKAAGMVNDLAVWHPGRCPHLTLEVFYTHIYIYPGIYIIYAAPAVPI